MKIDKNLEQLSLKNDTNSQNDEQRQEESQSDKLIRLVENVNFIKNNMDESFAVVEIDDHKEILPVYGRKFKRWLTKEFYMETKKSLSKDALNQALSVMDSLSIFEGDNYDLKRRVGKKKNSFYYDLVNDNWGVVKINRKEAKVTKNTPTLFIRSNNMEDQVEPDLSIDNESLLELIRKHFRFKTEFERILFTIYVVTCFIPDIPHPILVLHGEKGAAKSTTMRMVRSIVDPAKNDILALPTSKNDLTLTLSKNYMPCFDNLDTISPEKSDILCMAATGGGISKRRLYSDDDEMILSFKVCVVLNGINIAATRSDLLDRSIVLELERIKAEDRKTEKIVWNEFESDKPKILGVIFNTISKAMNIYPKTRLDKLGRMADFTEWGYAIAKALGIEGEQFLEAYLSNQNKANEEAIQSNPVAATIVSLMKSKYKWVGSVTDLLKTLETKAEAELIDTKVKIWPKASHVLSKRIKEVKSNLEQVGISYDIRHAGKYKKITIINVNNKEKKKKRDLNRLDKNLV